MAAARDTVPHVSAGKHFWTVLRGWYRYREARSRSADGTVRQHSWHRTPGRRCSAARSRSSTLARACWVRCCARIDPEPSRVSQPCLPGIRRQFPLPITGPPFAGGSARAWHRGPVVSASTSGSTRSAPGVMGDDERRRDSRSNGRQADMAWRWLRSRKISNLSFPTRLIASSAVIRLRKHSHRGEAARQC